MGNSLSPVLAIIYMYHVEKLIFEKIGSSVLLWNRYVDDIFIVAKVPLNELLPVINAVHDDITFTVELPTDDSIPFLDTRVYYNGQQFCTSLYIKELHSGHLLSLTSNVPMSRKTGLIRTERLRVERICPSTVEYQRAIERVKS